MKDSPLWAINIMNGTSMWFDDIYVNSTAVRAPFGKNWVQNTDGFDTMDAYNIGLTNFVYQGTHKLEPPHGTSTDRLQGMRIYR